MPLNERSEDDDSQCDDDDGDSISALFDNINNLTLEGDDSWVGGNEDDVASTLTSCTARSQQRKKLKRQSKKKGKSKSQHSLEHLRQHVSHLMSIFEENGWFIPLPDPSANQNNIGEGRKADNKKGKVWSNRNYGADKKRQRKQSEKQMLEGRIAQLESVLRDEHGYYDDHT